MKLTAVCFYRHTSSNQISSLSIGRDQRWRGRRKLMPRHPAGPRKRVNRCAVPGEWRRGVTMRKPGSNGAETLRNLRTAAIQLLAEHGYGAMNLRMLAKKVGVQASSLYNYIESKQQLLFLLCEETTVDLAAEFDRILEEVEDPAARLRKF